MEVISPLGVEEGKTFCALSGKTSVKASAKNYGDL
jgi:hypothetical protein